MNKFDPKNSAHMALEEGLSGTIALIDGEVYKSVQKDSERKSCEVWCGRYLSYYEKEFIQRHFEGVSFFDISWDDQCGESRIKLHWNIPDIEAMLFPSRSLFCGE